MSSLGCLLLRQALVSQLTPSQLNKRRRGAPWNGQEAAEVAIVEASILGIFLGIIATTTLWVVDTDTRSIQVGDWPTAWLMRPPAIRILTIIMEVVLVIHHDGNLAHHRRACIGKPYFHAF